MVAVLCVMLSTALRILYPLTMDVMPWESGEAGAGAGLLHY